ncbi:RNA 2',3'-cyclic phosphodiesterase [Salinicola avicenniae]|uniref:RNA 2',3'-cyclic phosphodiesterase n=1 Tax=Salinicola avicenniae TaxID=2916836 RepID=UPI002073762A|nr:MULTISPECIES: RNA 2',3'-cyclic phosphodiesterase [unclassified Salinicola]
MSRLFLALWPDADSRRALAAEAARLAPVCGGAPLPADNLHITLAFLGRVDDARQATLRHLTADWSPPAGEWRLDRLGHFPGPRIVWAGGDIPAALMQWHDALWRTLAAHGFTPPRKFIPHVSLVRGAERPAPDYRLEHPVRWPFGRLTLVVSTPGEAGSRYRTLGRSRAPMAHDRD